jgi:hypothetical protein
MQAWTIVWALIALGLVTWIVLMRSMLNQRR